MFTGRYRSSVDPKGRVGIPKALREFEDGMTWSKAVLTSGFDDCLFVYTLPEWTRLMNSVQKRTSGLPDVDVMLFQRLFAGSGIKVDVDRTNRVLIPQELREEAGLEGDCVWVGAIDRCELWSLDRWNEYRKESRKKLEQVWRKLSEEHPPTESHKDAQGSGQQSEDKA